MSNFDLHDAVLVVIALVNVITAVIAYSTRKLTMQVEVATNSMKDALVAAEKKVSFGEGREEMRAERDDNPGP
jgi:hypothetical protein